MFCVLFHVVHNKRCVDMKPKPYEYSISTSKIVLRLWKQKYSRKITKLLLMPKFVQKGTILLRKFNELKFKTREKKFLHYLPDRIKLRTATFNLYFSFFVFSMPKLRNISRNSKFSRTNRKMLPFPPYLLKDRDRDQLTFQLIVE
jgi:hypothetical protein